MPAYKNPITLSVNGTSFVFGEHVLKRFPEAHAFLTYLLAPGSISAAVATQYVKLVAKLKSNGKLAHPEALAHPTERTAANAYWRWIGDAYAARVQPVIRAFSDSSVRDGIQFLRRHSLVPPYEGKTVPRMTSVGTVHLDPVSRTALGTPATVEWFPCASWTLHVPQKACAPHQDPCLDCVPLELDGVLLEVLAIAFESAWGHRNLSEIPPECFLFGQAPREAVSGAAQTPAGRIVALVPAGAVASAIENLGGSVTAELDAFLARLKERADVVVVSRAVLGDDRFEDLVLSADSVVREAQWAASQAHMHANGDSIEDVIDMVPATT